MDSIAKTSLLTAAMRAVESQRTDQQGRLFSDPYADLLAGSEGYNLLQKAIAASGNQPSIAIRTFFIDQKISQALQGGVRQIVMLASGMDTRAYRFSFPKGVRIFELDRAEVLDYKQTKLYNVQPQCERHAIPVDLRKDWQGKLIHAGFKQGEQTLWLVEGLLMYLDGQQVELLLNRINDLARANDILLFDVLSQSLIEAPYMKPQLQFLASIGAPWHFGINEPEQFMEKFRWNAVATQAGEFAPERWPFFTVPRYIPNVPRGFFVEAIKF
jgi:methyltransferase (TIGR00027 family)